MNFGGMTNGVHKSGVPHHGGLTPSRIPLPAFPGAPHTQPYAIPSRGGVHGPIGAVPQGPQAGSRGFGAGRGSAGGPIGGHLPHHQASQSHGTINAGFSFANIENPATQPSVGGPLLQQGLMTQVKLDPKGSTSLSLNEGWQ